MRILFLMRQSNHYTNLFVPELRKQLINMGHSVEIGSDLFWTPCMFDFDIIHIHWPEFIFATNNPSESNIENLRLRLQEAKNAKIPIVVHCHNLKPHDVKNGIACKLYDVVYDSATAFIHMGQYSKILLQSEYINAIHTVIPHHIYDISHHFCYDNYVCKRELDLPENRICILCFGKFRNDEERIFFLKCRERFRDHKVIFVAPGFYRDKIISRDLMKSIRNFFKFLKYKVQGIRFSSTIISENLMEKYFFAADIVLIQRKTILNSGNLPMAFACGKIVVGPNVGNVGEILKATGNPLFEADNIDSAKDAILAGIGLLNECLGARNKEYARQNWSSSVVTRKLIDFYYILKDGDNK